MEGNLSFKIDWASLKVGSKFTIFALFYFVFEGNFPSTSPRGAYIRRGDLTEGFLHYEFGGGAYIWRGLPGIHGGAYFRNCTVVLGAFIKTNVCVYSFSPFNGVTKPASTLPISSAIS